VLFQQSELVFESQLSSFKIPTFVFPQNSSIMKTRILHLASAIFLTSCLISGCKTDNLPEGLDWSVTGNPARFPLMSGKVALVYEVKVKNSSIDTYYFESVRVSDGTAVVLDLAGSRLDSIISVYHSAEKYIKAGETGFLFMWIELPDGALLPESLTQSMNFNRTSDGRPYTGEMKIPVGKSAPLILSAPLKQRRYATAGAPANNSYHRRTINFIDEKFWTSQRYAVDLIGLDDGNRYRDGLENINADYYGYDDIVYSATAGTVVSVIDTIANNIPPKVPDIVPSALYRAGGNQVVVKVSGDAYVYYGHLVRASTELHAGDKVEIGQPLGRLGNSGNSDAPQLHIQVMDGADPLRSNGVPWVFDRFVLHGNITGYDQASGMIRVNYLTIQKEITQKNFGNDAVVGFE
jgi:hypothetical protein